MLTKYKFLKTISKGLEEAALAGVATAVVTFSELMAEAGDVEKVVATAAASVVGFAIGAIRNWVKNRKK